MYQSAFRKEDNNVLGPLFIRLNMYSMKLSVGLTVVGGEIR